MAAALNLLKYLILVVIVAVFALIAGTFFLAVVASMLMFCFLMTFVDREPDIKKRHSQRRRSKPARQAP